MVLGPKASYNQLATYSIILVFSLLFVIHVKTKYSALEPKYSFFPVALESSGVLGPKALSFLHNMGSRLMSSVSTATV